MTLVSSRYSGRRGDNAEADAPERHSQNAADPSQQTFFLMLLDLVFGPFGHFELFSV